MNRRYWLTGVGLVFFLVSGVLVIRKNVIHVADLPSAYAEGVKVRGTADAPVEIQEFSDFQCPACQRAQSVLHEMLEKYPGKIKIVFRHFPLSGHQWSSIAHQAAECSNSQGKFWEFHDLLFQEQAVWSGPQNPTQLFMKNAQILSLNLDDFAACLGDLAVRDRIMEERKIGEGLQVRSTPTFFINGERFVGHVELRDKGQQKIREILGLPPELPALDNEATSTPKDVS